MLCLFRRTVAVGSLRRWRWTLHSAAVCRPVDVLQHDMDRQAQREAEWELDFTLLEPLAQLGTFGDVVRCCCAAALKAARFVERLSVTVSSAAVLDAVAAMFCAADAVSLRFFHLTLYDTAFRLDDCALAVLLKSASRISSRLESLRVTVVACDMRHGLQWRHKAVGGLIANIHSSALRVLSLEYVDMHGAPDEELAAFCAAVSRCHALTHLSLRGGRDFFFRAPTFCTTVSEMRELEAVDFSSTMIGDVLVEQLFAALKVSIGGWYRLRQLNLAETNVSAWGLRRMLDDVGSLSPGETARTEVLNFNSNSINAEGCFFLAGCCMRCGLLRELHLRHNRLTKESAAVLGSALTTASSLRCLNLHSNPLGDEGLQRLLKYAGHWTGLRHLDVTRCRLTARCFPALCDALSLLDKLEELMLDRNDLRTLETIPANCQGDATESELQLFAYDQHFMQSGGRGDMKVLTSFEIERRDALDGRRRFKGTESLCTSFQPHASIGGVAAFERLGVVLSGRRELRRLSLSGCSLTDASFAALTRALIVSSMTDLNVSANPVFARRESVEALAALLRRSAAHLRTVDLSCTGLDCVGVSLLADGACSTTTAATDTTDEVSAFRSLVVLTQLRLSNCCICADGFETLAEVVPAIVSLEELFLDGNAVGDVGPVVFLLEALMTLPSLKFVGLHGTVSQDGVASVAASRGYAILRSRGVIVHL